MVSRLQNGVAPHIPLPIASPPPPNRRPRARSNRRTRNQKLLAFLLIVCVGMTTAYLAVRNTTIYVQNASIQSMETELNQLKKHNERMRNEVTQLQSPKKMIQTAIQMGLLLPNTSAISPPQQQPVAETATPERTSSTAVADRDAQSYRR